MVVKKCNSQFLMNLPDTNAQKHVSHNVATQTVTLAALGTSVSGGLPGRVCTFDALMHQLLLIF
jgi:hypothetical protein